MLMIMGLFVGLVSAIVHPDDRDLLRLEAGRLAQLLDLAATEAQLTGRSIAWTADEKTYRFWTRDMDKGWSEIRDNDLLRARQLPQDMQIAGLRIENISVPGVMRIEFIPHGLAPSFSINMSLGVEYYTVAGSPIGEMRVLPGAGKTDG